MTDQLNPEDRALIELNTAGLSVENAALISGTGLTPRSGQGIGFYVPGHIFNQILDAARTEGRRSGEGGEEAGFLPERVTEQCGSRGEASVVATAPLTQDEGRIRVAVEMGIHRWLEWEFPGVAQEYATGVDHILDSIMSLPLNAPTPVDDRCERHGNFCKFCGYRACLKAKTRASTPPVEAKPAEGDKEAHVAQIILGMMVPTDCFQTAEMRQRAMATAQRLLAMTTREAIPARDEAALPEGWVAVPRSSDEAMELAGASLWLGGGIVHAMSDEWRKRMSQTWSAMLAASPAHPVTGTDEPPADVVRLVKAVEAAAEQIDQEGHGWPAEIVRSALAPFASRVPLNEGEGR